MGAAMTGKEKVLRKATEVLFSTHYKFMKNECLEIR